MINVNQLTSELRMMPDQALQRMAMMYKNDPYIFPMVISEDMARKKLRQAAQAQAVQPQPTVRDQALMAIEQPPAPAPGIAALQAPNLANMADGGIAGADEIATYADGGDVVMAPGSTPSYQRTAMSPGMLDFAQHSEPVIRMAEGGVPGYAGEGRSLVRLDDYDPLTDILAAQGLRTPAGESYADMKARQRREKELAAAAEAEGRPLARGLRGIESAQMTPSPATYALQQGATALRRALYPTQEELGAAPAAKTSAAAPAAESAPRVPTMGGRSTGVGGPQVGEREAYAAARAAQNRPPAGEQPPAATGAPAFRSDSSLYSLDPAVLRKRAQGIAPTGEYEAMYKELERKELSGLEEREAERERNKPTGKARAGLEALLQEEGKGEAKEFSDAKAFALLSASLAVAAGESPNALTNIAKGLGVGAKEYQAAVKDLKKASRERRLMLADIEEARRLEARGDYDRAEDRKDRAEERRASIRRNTMQGIMGLRLNQDQIAAGFAKAAQEGGIRRDIAGLELGAAQSRLAQQLAAPTGEMRLMAALDPTGMGNIAKGFEAAQQMRREPMTREKLYLEYTKNPLADPAKFGEYVKEYERQFGPLGGTTGAAPQSADSTGFRVVGVRNP